MKKYELEIEAVHTENQRIYRSKGHWSEEEFKQALIEYGIDVEDYTKPQHKLCKTVPVSKHSFNSCLYVFVEEAGRGVYPATYVWEK